MHPLLGKYVCLCCLIIICTASTVKAQQKTPLTNTKIDSTLQEAQKKDWKVKITLVDDRTVTGFVLLVDELSVTLETQLGELKIRYERIQEITILDPEDPTSEWFANPNESRLFITPTARMLNKGEGYYQNIFIFFSNFSYALTDRITANAGFSMIPGLGFNQLFLFSVKGGYSFSERSHIAGGLSLFTVPETDFNGSALYPYVVYSYGTVDANININLGQLVTFEASSAPLLVVGGEKRLGKRISLVSENFLGLGEVSNLIPSVGLRFLGESISVDLAGFIETDSGLIIPFLDFAYRF